MRRLWGIVLLCATSAGCSVIDAATGEDDEEEVVCSHDVCYLVPDTITPPLNVRMIAAGDFDGDESIDIAVTDLAGDLYLLLNDDPGDLGTLSQTDLESDLSEGPEAIAAGDVNGDGIAEVVAVLGGDEQIAVRGPAIAPFQMSVGSPRDAVVAEINGDEFRDVIVISNVSPSKVVVLRGRDAGGFAPTPTELEIGPPIVDVAPGDFDKDGDLDLAVLTSDPDWELAIYDNDGFGDLTAAGTPFRPCLINCPTVGTEQLIDVVVADFNGDTDDDLAIQVKCESGCGTPYEAIRFLEAVSLDQWQEIRNAELDFRTTELSAADLDADGSTDVLWQEHSEFPEWIALYRDYFTSATPDIGHIDINDIAVDTVLVDLNGDSYPDIVTATDKDRVDVVLTTE